MAKKFLVPVILAEGTVGAPGLYFGPDTTTGLYRTAANQIGFTVSGTNRLNIHSGGADVTGSMVVTSTSDYQGQVVSRHVGSTVGSGPYFIMDRTRAAAAAVVSGDTIGTILWRGWDGSAYVNGPYILGQVDSTVSAGVVPMSMIFVGGGSERMRMDSSGKILVGFQASKFYGGVFQVSGQMSVVGATTSTTSQVVVGSNTALDAGSPSYQLAAIYYHGSAEAGNLTYCPTVAKSLAAEFTAVNSNAMVFTTNNAAPMVFATNATERLRIAGTGLVTIASTLNITGTTKAAGTFDAGSTAPTNTTRLNYDGDFYATNFYGNGSQLEGVAKVNNFRLTLTTAIPVTTSDVTGATTIYCCPYNGNLISLYDGTKWITRTSAQFSLALGTLTSGKPYDVFCYDNAGTPALELLAWTDDTNRATALAYQDGVLVKSGTATRRYLGTFYTTSTTQTEDSVANRYLWNYYNRVVRSMKAVDTTTSWTYTIATWREARATTTNRLNMVIGVSEDVVNATVVNVASGSAAGNAALAGIGADSTSAQSATVAGYSHIAVTNDVVEVVARYTGVLGAGKHYLSRLEKSSTTGGVMTWYGKPGSDHAPGICGSLMC